MTIERDPMLGRYTVACDNQECLVTRVAYFPYALGLQVGDKAPTSVSEPGYGRCHKCLRYSLRVITLPEKPPPKKPVGFTKIPTE